MDPILLFCIIKLIVNKTFIQTHTEFMSDLLKPTRNFSDN